MKRPTSLRLYLKTKRTDATTVADQLIFGAGTSESKTRSLWGCWNYFWGCHEILTISLLISILFGAAICFLWESIKFSRKRVQQSQHQPGELWWIVWSPLTLYLTFIFICITIASIVACFKRTSRSSSPSSQYNTITTATTHDEGDDEEKKLVCFRLFRWILAGSFFVLILVLFTLCLAVDHIVSWWMEVIILIVMIIIVGIVTYVCRKKDMCSRISTESALKFHDAF